MSIQNYNCRNLGLVGFTNQIAFESDFQVRQGPSWSPNSTDLYFWYLFVELAVVTPVERRTFVSVTPAAKKNKLGPIFSKNIRVIYKLSVKKQKQGKKTDINPKITCFFSTTWFGPGPNLVQLDFMYIIYIERIFEEKNESSMLFVAAGVTDTKVRHSTGVATTNSTNKNPNANKLSWAINYP